MDMVYKYVFDDIRMFEFRNVYKKVLFSGKMYFGI